MAKKLRFKNIDQLQEFLPRLIDTRHQNLGKWTTAQILFHLAAAFEGSIEGIGVGFPSWVRSLLRPFRWIVTRIKFPPWVPIPIDKLFPPETAEFSEQYERLIKAIDRFVEYDEVHPDHPVLGKLTRSEWVGFHLRHCERHLSFIKMDDIRQE